MAAAAAAAVCVLGEDGEDVGIIKLGEDVGGDEGGGRQRWAAQLREELSGGGGGGGGR